MAAGNQAYTVLVVDDNPELLNLIAESLAMLGNYTVETAANGIEGLEKCLAAHPQCMVIDVKMPGLDGYQLVRAIRGDPATADIPLVILTAMAQDKDRFAGLAAGVDYYLLKPIKPLELVAIIHRAVMTDEETRIQSLRRLAGEQGSV
jgi:CheY-like chemotaxis protein